MATRTGHNLHGGLANDTFEIFTSGISELLSSKYLVTVKPLPFTTVETM